MKETNMEHYRGEIEKIMARHKHCLPAVVDGKPTRCEGLRCTKCMLYEATEPCSIHFVKWLMSEYKPEPVLTAREKHFVECIEDGYIARDENPYRLFWHPTKPRKIQYTWTHEKEKREEILISNIFNSNAFPFITWEDEEAWSVEDLRKLKVEGGVADET